MASSPLNNFARKIARPFTRPLDGRVADVNRRVHDVGLSVAVIGDSVEVLTRELGAYTATLTESNSYVGIEMRRLQEAVDMLQARIDEHEAGVMARMDSLADKGYVERLNRAAEAPLDRLEGPVAHLVNHASGHRGFAAQAGLWFNPPATVELHEGQARLAAVNERIVEMPFALAALSRLSPPARVLDIGSAESTFSLSVASLGHRVTALDLHPLPYTHPNIHSVVGRFEDWDPGSALFDAVFLISTIEHFGLGAYGEPTTASAADRAAVERVADLLEEGGFMVLTTPYGPASVDGLERTYDEQALGALLEGWTIVERSTVFRRDELTWMAVDSDVSVAGGEKAVVMVVAVPARPA
jgi:Caenorhabditis protein of unknown function, DUF268